MHVKPVLKLSNQKEDRTCMPNERELSTSEMSRKECTGLGVKVYSLR